MATWTLSNPAANAEGNQIVFDVVVTGNGSEIPDTPDLDESNKLCDSDVARGAVGPIYKWRFNAITAQVTQKTSASSAADGGVAMMVLFDMGERQDLGGGTYSIAFKAAIRLNPGAHVAIRPSGSASEAEILELRDGWIALKFPGGAALDDSNQGDDVAVPFDASAVGRLPEPASAKYSTDAIGQYVEDDGPSSHLATWSNLFSGNDLTGEPSTEEPELGASSSRPFVEFATGAASSQRFADASPPTITTDATIAAVFTPDQTSDDQTIVGLYPYNSPGWRLTFNNDGALELRYQSYFDLAETSVTVEWEGEPDPIFIILRRDADTLEAWVNGVPATLTGTPANSVAASSGPFMVGARRTGAHTWGDEFIGHINQVGVYADDVDDLRLSLIMHQMAMRAGIALGMPIPEAYQTQPYDPENNAQPNRVLQRRPIAVITLFNGMYDGGNTFGQSAFWRDDTQADIEAALRNRLREIFTACDQFEVMFNRPGGKHVEDIVPTYVFGSYGGDAMITETMWLAMKAVWGDSGYNDWELSDHNDDNGRLRRGWFYTGGPLPLDDDGTLVTNGRMGNRAVGPATPLVYETEILSEWSSEDSRFRCLFLDVASTFAGQFVALVHDASVNEDYTLVGEAIPTDQESRNAAPWFALVRFAKAPWWNLNEDDPPVPERAEGYNPLWATDPQAATTYFAVLLGPYSNLAAVDPDTPGEGSNLTLSEVYTWILKGGTPVAWNGPYVRIGAAWDYATGRITASRVVRQPRTLRCARV